MNGIPQDDKGFSCHLCDYASPDAREIIAHWNKHIDEACFDGAIKQVHYPSDFLGGPQHELAPPRHLRLVKS